MLDIIYMYIFTLSCFFPLFIDVKPSNILINKQGEIKLCDFGIAGELVNSYVGTNIGCKPYLAPERINPSRMDDPYDQRSDVWSYGITIVSTIAWVLESNIRTIN